LACFSPQPANFIRSLRAEVLEDNGQVDRVGQLPDDVQDDQPTIIIGDVGVVPHHVNASCTARRVEGAHLGRVGLVSNGDETEALIIIGDVGVGPHEVNVIYRASRVEVANKVVTTEESSMSSY
jgi:hypothetical protein